MKPFNLIEDKESREIVDIKFTASPVTVFFGRYDNESPPFLIISFKITINYLYEK